MARPMVFSLLIWLPFVQFKWKKFDLNIARELKQWNGKVCIEGERNKRKQKLHSIHSCVCNIELDFIQSRICCLNTYIQYIEKVHCAYMRTKVMRATEKDTQRRRIVLAVTINARKWDKNRCCQFFYALMVLVKLVCISEQYPTCNAFEHGTRENTKHKIVIKCSTHDSVTHTQQTLHSLCVE